MTKGFGFTWWGERWLRALDDIDCENRLPRGAAYARSGHVETLIPEPGYVNSMVVGSGGRLYDVIIKVPTFNKREISRLMDEIVANPSLLTNLLNRELDIRILDIATRLGLKVFPESWEDLKMSCNCPDHAVPCKHIAAVIYMLSREIDNNPFLIFQLRGVDLIQELRNRGIEINQVSGHEPPTTSSRFLIAEGDDAGHQLYNPAEGARSLNFTRLTSIGQALCNVLADYPPFYDKGDFKDVYEKDTARVSKAAGKVLMTMNVNSFMTDEGEMPIDREEDWAPVLNDYMELSLGEKLLDHSMERRLVKALLSLPYEMIIDYSPAVVAMRHALFVALNLLKYGAFRPLLTLRPSDNFAIDWIPASLDENVRMLMAELEPHFPTGTLLAQLTDREEPVPITNQGEMMVGYFLNVLVSMLSRDTHLHGDIVRNIFLNQVEYDFLDAGEKEKPGNIAAWLSRLEVEWDKYIPVFKVEEVGEDGLFFNVSVLCQEMGNDEKSPIPLSDLLSDKESYESENFEFIRRLSSLSSLVTGLSDYIDDGAETPIQMHTSVFSRFLMDSIPAVRFLGVKVILPQTLTSLIRPQPSMTIYKGSKAQKISYLNLDSILAFNWQVSLGDEMMSLGDFNRLVGRASGLIRYKSGYIYVGESDLQRLQKAFREQKPLTPVQVLQIALSEEYEGTKVTLDAEVRKLIDTLTSPHPEPLPEGITADVRPYQERGYSWMWRNLRIGFGSIIADDMGLGKTLQVILLLMRLKQEGALCRKKALVVAPTGLLTNWQAEIEKFAPSLSSFIYHGPQRGIWEFHHDVLITSYGVLRSDENALKNMKWRIMVIDEAQTIKNANTAQSKSVRAIPADNHIAMSGTPVENRLSEYWTIMDFVNKGYLGTAKGFQKEFVRPIQNDGDPRVAERFRKITGPLMMRRMKTDKSIISDLPEKIEENLYAALTPRQAALYQKVVESAMAEIEGIGSVDNQSMFKRQGLVLQMILALKQICNHPAQFLKDKDYAPELSGKVEMLLELIRVIVERGEKVLVFTQFREMGEILVKIIEERMRRRPMFYHGGSTPQERQQMIEAFQTDPRKQVFLLSLRAAGVGLNLTAASHVIHFDLWWNPAVEAQATDRAYRIGQGKNVVVHRLITHNTFEEKIDAMIQRKKELAAMTVTAGENWIGRLSNTELHEIFDRR